MVAAGVSPRAVQEIGGWSSLRMLERYAHPTGDEMARAVTVLAEHTGTKTGTAAYRAVKSEEPEIRKRVVGLEDWSGVPNARQLEPDRQLAQADRHLASGGLSTCRSVSETVQ